jgi:histidyl-tRNA synthetase
MAQLQAVRGTQDVLPAEARRQRLVTDTARLTAERYGFGEIATPIFEFTEVFSRPIGETSDIVSKEMYTFQDRGGEEVTLRPEGTAGVVRAVMSNGLTQSLPLKFFYAGPMFRYERPQKGRYRQFSQIGVELLGPSQPQADIEVIALGADILDALGILKSCVLELNTLGDAESRAAYRTVLVEYLSGHLGRLSEESRGRLGRNPLRILDSKDAGDREVVAEAPSYADYLNPASRTFFDAVRRGLDGLGIGFTVNPRLVRGLDYYCHTAFEFITTQLGAQGTVLAGGRYDGLMAMMGGPDVAGVGWAGGIERLSMLLAEPPVEKRPIVIVPVGDAAEPAALKLAHDLRRAGFVIEMGYGGNVGKRMKHANKINACAALVLGETELAAGIVMLRDLDKGEQREVALSEISSHLASFR